MYYLFREHEKQYTWQNAASLMSLQSWVDIEGITPWPMRFLEFHSNIFLFLIYVYYFFHWRFIKTVHRFSHFVNTGHTAIFLDYTLLELSLRARACERSAVKEFPLLIKHHTRPPLLIITQLSTHTASYSTKVAPYAKKGTNLYITLLLA